MAKFIKLNALCATSISSDVYMTKEINAEICLNTNNIVLIEQREKGCCVYVNSPIISEDSELTSLLPSKINVEESYNDVVAMIGC